MINEFEFYHGATLAKLVHQSKHPLTISTFQTASNASYVINRSAGLYIKHSTKRMTPWRFSFKREHQNEIKHLRQLYGDVFILFVCHQDGVVVLSYDELKHILDEVHEEYEWISIDRNRRQEYTVKGSDGTLGRKVARNEFPQKILIKIEC